MGEPRHRHVGALVQRIEAELRVVGPEPGPERTNWVRIGSWSGAFQSISERM
jgi:hypothetical protein